MLKSEDFRALAGPQKAAIFMLAVTRPFRRRSPANSAVRRVIVGSKAGSKNRFTAPAPDGATKLAGADPCCRGSV